MNCKLIYMIPELLELGVPGGVVAGESGRNVDLRAPDAKWHHYSDDSDDDEVGEADDEDIL